LLKEVVALSDKVTLTVHDVGVSKDEALKLEIDRVPAFVINGAARGKVRFFGIPSGYEFSSLIAGIIDVSRGTTSLSDETREYLASLTEDINLKVFTTPT
jgi:alkyl hydroperoxide reductase subunit AhpF